MNKKTYLTLIKWAFELHCSILLLIRKFSSYSELNDEFLEINISSADFVIENLKEDLASLNSQNNNEEDC